jgi:hypothetical protein
MEPRFARFGARGRRSLVNDTSLKTILKHIEAEETYKTLLGTDESDDLSSIISSSMLKACIKRFGDVPFADLLRAIER